LGIIVSTLFLRLRLASFFLLVYSQKIKSERLRTVRQQIPEGIDNTMKIKSVFNGALGIIAASAVILLGTNSAVANQHGQRSHADTSHRDQIYYRNHFSSGVHVGGSWGSQSAYNNHQHHNLMPHRHFYTYNGNHYYLDLDSGLRIQI
jgi:hypothetical protein